MYTLLTEQLFFIYEQHDMEMNLLTSMNELSLLDTNSKFNSFTHLHEALNENLKQAFEQLMKAVEEMFVRFKVKAKQLTDINRKLIEDNKEKILQGKDGKISIRKYWDRKSAIMEPIPRYDFSRLSESLKTDEDFINEAFKKFVPKNEGETYIDVAKAHFRGPKVENIILNKNIISSMYTFCMEYYKNVEILVRQENDIKKAGKEAINKIKQQNNIQNNKDIANESYSLLLSTESVIYEDNVTINDDNPANKSNNDRVKQQSTTNKEDIARIRRYIKICTNIIGAKMTILEEAYRNYITIFKWIIGKKTDVVKNPEKDTKNKKENKESDNKK